MRPDWPGSRYNVIKWCVANARDAALRGAQPHPCPCLQQLQLLLRCGRSLQPPCTLSSHPHHGPQTRSSSPFAASGPPAGSTAFRTSARSCRASSLGAWRTDQRLSTARGREARRQPRPRASTRSRGVSAPRRSGAAPRRRRRLEAGAQPLAQATPSEGGGRLPRQQRRPPRWACGRTGRPWPPPRCAAAKCRRRRLPPLPRPRTRALLPPPSRHQSPSRCRS